MHCKTGLVPRSLVKSFQTAKWLISKRIPGHCLARILTLSPEYTNTLYYSSRKLFTDLGPQRRWHHRLTCMMETETNLIPTLINVQTKCRNHAIDALSRSATIGADTTTSNLNLSLLARKRWDTKTPVAHFIDKECRTLQYTTTRGIPAF